ncbi:MAG TPA: vitamin K epoxide reductase family protein [Solirubrobacteraceae bacterium]|jgi:uncharacterized membrane protein|nr:vitamin K epoxide reductase family protein [Solirubrobacteraceae bacterium]
MLSRRGLKITMIVLTVIGLGVASYLTYVHYSGIKPACSLGGSCELVQTSAYSHLAGVPVALIGLIGYVSILLLLLLPETETTRLAAVGVTAIGFGFSAYLTGRELFSIHAICEWCVSSAVIMTMLVCLAVWRFLLADELPAGAAPAAGARPETASSLGAITS